MTPEKIPVGTGEPESHKNFEDFLSREIPRQFEVCAESLRKVGLLEEIVQEPNDIFIDMREGITAMNGKKYELPSVKKIAEHFKAEKYREKFEQGFTRLLIVPFGYPIATLRIRYEQQLLKHHQEGRLLDRDSNRLELDRRMPLGARGPFDETDEFGTMIYYAKHFAEKHGGRTKQELLNDNTEPFPGFHVLLIKPELTIPREGAGKTTGTRKDIETNKSSIDYLQLLTELQYCNEKGFTIEDSIVLAMIHLDQTDQIIDDYENNKDSLSFNIGNFHSTSRSVPVSYWNRDFRQAFIYRGNPTARNGDCGVRVAVG